MSNLYDALKPRYPEDVRKLREKITFLTRFSDKEIEALYKAFSSGRCAQWVRVGLKEMVEFEDWLSQ